MASRRPVIWRGALPEISGKMPDLWEKPTHPEGEMAMKWFILAGIWVFFFLVWHAHTIFGEDD
jgi:hypothetical protein